MKKKKKVKSPNVSSEFVQAIINSVCDEFVHAENKILNETGLDPAAVDAKFRRLEGERILACMRKVFLKAYEYYPGFCVSTEQFRQSVQIRDYNYTQVKHLQKIRGCLRS